MNTPWGKADDIQTVREGVYWVSTPSHGGVMVNRYIGDQILSDKAKEVGAGFGYSSTNPWSRDWYVFEEDCDWQVVAKDIPEVKEF